MRFETERLGHDFKVPQADFDLPSLYFGDVAAVGAHFLGQFELRPTLCLAELANAYTEAHADVAGHTAIIVRRLWPTK